MANADNELFTLCAKYLEKYEIISAITNGQITAQIINYMNKKDYTEEEFAKDIGVPYKKIREWVSANYDFTITDLAFLFDKSIITKAVFGSM